MAYCWDISSHEKKSQSRDIEIPWDFQLKPWDPHPGIFENIPGFSDLGFFSDKNPKIPGFGIPEKSHPAATSGEDPFLHLKLKIVQKGSMQKTGL